MKAFNNFGKNEEFQPIVSLSNGKYLVNFDKVEQVNEEVMFKNSKMVGTGKMIPTGNASWKTIIFDKKPTVGIIEEAIFDIINKEVNYIIVNGFKYKGYVVHLSLENQMNYKNAYDLAVSTNGETLPVTFKFYKRNKAEYYTFDNLEDLKSFYIGLNNHINKTLENGWKHKDKFNRDDYKI